MLETTKIYFIVHLIFEKKLLNITFIIYCLLFNILRYYYNLCTCLFMYKNNYPIFVKGKIVPIQNRLFKMITKYGYVS